jgi:hypothetical protein
MPEAAIGPIIGGAVSGAAGLAGSALQSGAAGKASAQAQRDLQLVVPQLQQNYNTAVSGFQPFEDVSKLSLADQQDLLGLNGPDAATAAMSKFQTSPGYQFSMDQGMRAIDAGAASKGLLHSGATIKAEQTFGTGLADQEFSNYFGRLNSLSNMGLTAAGGISTAGNNLASGLENNAQSQATTAIGAGNAQSSIFGNAASGFGNTVNSLFSNPTVQNALFGSSPATNTTFNGFAPAMVPGQVGVGGFTAI